MANEIHADCASGDVLYAVIRDRAGRVWYATAQGFEEWGTDDHTAADYAIDLTDKNGSRHVGHFDANIPAGAYSIQVFAQAGAAAADTDTLVAGRQIVWTGVGELTALKFLANRAVHDKSADTLAYYDDDGQTVLLTHVRTEDAFTCEKTPQG